MVRRKHKGESFESLMRRFKKTCEKSNIILEVKRREFYEKPSSIRKRTRDIAKKKEQKRQEDQRIHRI
jgi:small subunit ribosomal protein S21